MRFDRRSVVTLGVVAVLVTVGRAIPGGAQPAAPTVTITGLVDTVTSWTSNLGIVDLDYARTGDTEWYARTRVRPDIVAELAATKFVLGLEIDFGWGQTGATDVGAPQRIGLTAGADLNTDLLPIVELKWAYLEFGVPVVPWATRARVGAQPFRTTYKPGVLATGDFGGVDLTSRVSPSVALNLTWVQVEEESTGRRDGFLNGEDVALVASTEIRPARGVDVRPLYALFVSDGATSGASRQGRGGLGTGAATYPARATEWRHTAGIDARWRTGGFSAEPTVLYQWGSRDVVASVPFAALGRGRQERSAWLVDLRGGWRSGPFHVEAAAIYATGNSADEDVRSPRRTIRFFEPIDTDTSFYAGWAEVWGKGIEDNINIVYARAAGLNTSIAPSFDKYGLVRAGSRGSYAVAPAFTVRGALTANWTAEEVDTSSTLAAATGLTPGDGRGDERFLGVELDLGFQWRFAPGVALDVVAAYMWAGDAMGQATATSTNGIVRSARTPQDIQTAVARLRFVF